MRYSAIGSLCVLSLLIGCSGSSSNSLANEGQEALRVIELAESLYFAEAGSNPALQSEVMAVNDAAEAALAAYGSSTATPGAVVQNIEAALSALQSINSAYAELPSVDAGRAAQFQQCLVLAQAAVAVAVQLASPS